jgi:organic radical activating enzyme
MKMNQLFYKRCLRIYALHSLQGKNWGKRYAKTAVHILRFILRIARLKFEFYFLGNIYLPYIEIVITTRCTLKCKYCSNYINTIEEKDHYSLTFEEFKRQLDNLLANVKKLHVLKIFGGEPLLDKDLDKILRYSLANKKISNVVLTTNGTMDISDKLISIMKEYPEKMCVNLSNYTSNKELSSRLKTIELFNKCKENSISAIFDEDLLWTETSEIKYTGRSPKEIREYFLNCILTCIHVINGKLYPCPKAGIYDLQNLYLPSLPIINDWKAWTREGAIEKVDLSNPVKKGTLVRFYSNSDYLACGFCSIIEDALKKKVIPAIQE